MHAGVTFNFKLKAPAAICLICWEEQGINALVEGAKRTPSSKNAPITLQLLSVLAAGTLPRPFMTFANADLQNLVLQLFRDTPNVRNFARQRLTEFMFSLPDDDEVSMAAGTVFQRLSFGDTRAAKDVFAALASRWLTFGKPRLQAIRN